MIDPSESVSRASPAQRDAPNVLGALRAATAERHELLHTIMPLSVDSVALRDYLAHLTILRDWLAPLEAWLQHFDDGPQAATQPSRLDRLALIDADLTDPAAAPSTNEGTIPAPADDHPWHGPQSAAFRWGVCYVIEGSQLGGAVLYARLHERLAPHPLGFLAAGRETLGPRWRAFVQALSAEVATPETIDEACRGAAAAFDRLIDHANHASHARCAAMAACADAR
ncbi:biliverdin-producing heme oxygenase [Paraburkholderia sp. D15]|uniref:biliverdin-producing heme oxygenase n=1 Tax=Paraburkholderia sp. D15 TaxID=2880218 RepID=UPI0032B062FD